MKTTCIVMALIMALSISTEASAAQKPKTCSVKDCVQANDEVSFVISSSSSVDELEKIKALAEKAGMSFRYKTVGIFTDKLAVTAVIDQEDGFEMKHYVLKESDGVIILKWSLDEEGLATGFIEEQDCFTEKK